MELQGRELRLNMQGDDVAQLHQELKQAGQRVDTAEETMKLYGRTTHDAVVQIQKQAGLSASGIVDQSTAAAVTTAGASSGPAAMAGPSMHAAKTVASSPTEAPQPSMFARQVAALRPLLGGTPITDLTEAGQHQDVNFISSETGLAGEDVARIALAHQLETASELPAELFYGLLSQGLPPSAPSSLLEANGSLSTVLSLVARMASGLYSLSPSLQAKAIATAAQQGLIANDLAQNADTLVASLQQRRVTDALEQPFMVGKTPLRDLLTAAGLPIGKHLDFTKAFLTTRGNNAEFWRNLPTAAGLTPEETTQVRRTLEIGSFMKNSLPLIQAIQARFSTGQIKDPRELARWTLDDWKHLITDTSADGQAAIPPNIDGATEDARAGTFAQEILDRVTRAYPTTALVSRMTNPAIVPNPFSEHVATLLDSNPSIDLRRNNVRVMAAANPDLLKGIPAEAHPLVLGQVSSLQRVIRLVPHADTATTLLTLGLDSAAKIYGLGKAQFVEQVAATGASRIEARKTFYRAEQRYAALLSYLTQYNVAFNQRTAAAVPPIELTPVQQQIIDGEPTLQTLFGSQDFCDCQECNSVLSAAAYVADLLCYLGDRHQTSRFPNAQEALLARRPDLATVLLNCANTNTVLPYVDLVCELLEDAVAPPPAPHGRQTTLTPQELRAYPEHVNAAAYEVLAQAAFPHTLPYQTWLDEMRCYLGAIGVERWQLMRAFADRHDPSAAPTPTQIAGEFFGMSARDLELITQAGAVPLTEAWDLTDPVTALTTVSSFLDASGLDYEQLRALLEVAFVRGGGPASTLGNVTDACDTTTQTISNLSADRLDLIHRFLRLWRRGGWAIWELGLVLAQPAIGSARLDADSLTQLMAFRRLQTTLGLAADELMAFLGPIDTTDHRDDVFALTVSLYARLFLNPAVTNPPDPALAVTAVTAPTPAETISGHAPAVLAALQVREQDLDQLLPHTDGTLSLANLSLLYRHTRLATALGLSAADLARLSRWAGLADPFASLEAVQMLADVAADIKRTRLPLDELGYLLSTEPSPLVPGDETLTAILTRLRSQMQKTHDDFADDGQPPDQLLARRLPLAPGMSDPATLATALSIATGSFDGTSDQRDAFIATYLTTFADATAARSDLGALTSDPADPSARAAEIAARCRFLLDGLARYATRLQVRQVTASAFGLPDDVGALVLDQLRLAASTVTALDALSDTALIEQGTDGKSYIRAVDEPSFPAMFEALRRAHKVTTLITRIRVSRDELAWLIGHASDYGGVNPAALPVLAGDPASSLPALLATADLVTLARTLTAVPGDSLLDLIAAVADGSDLASTTASIARIGGWDPADVAAASQALGLQYPADYLAVETYQELRRCLGLTAMTGVRAARLAGWAQREPTAQDAEIVRQAVKARYDEPGWLTVAPTLQDPVRERRRQGLVDYLLGHPPAGASAWRDANDLLAYFLIDVEMSPCQLTSRIVQAYTSIQLFVQRCLMNREQPDVTADSADDGWRQWSWMQRFRLWQANREVFLYPENWLLEADRPNTSPIFREFADELNQGEITSDHVENAFLHYLDKLHAIAHLEVTGIYDDRAQDITHVIARTKSSPPRFYYRRLVNRQWTPWEKIDLDIKATHVVPVIFRRHLHLFWLVITVRTERDQQLPAAQPGPPKTAEEPAKHAEIQIGWSSYRSGKWEAAQVSEGRLFDMPPDPSQNYLLDEHNYTLKLIPSPSSIIIDLYRTQFIRRA